MKPLLRIFAALRRTQRTGGPRGLRRRLGDIAANAKRRAVGICAAPLCLAAVAAAPPAAAQVAYSIDDGAAETSIILVAGTETRPTLWLNAFDAQPGGDLITTISVTWGRTSGGPSGVPVQAPTSVLLYQDDPSNDGDPRTATLLVNQPIPNGAPAGSIDTGVFLDVPITPTLVSGTFFVAALYLDPSEGFPAPLDTDDPDLPGKSWVFSNAENSVNVINLGGPGNFGGLIEAPPYGLSGNWLLRAQGVDGGPPVATSEYSIVDVGTLGGNSSWAYGLNNVGQVVGQSALDLQPGGDSHAFLWDAGAMTDLGDLGGSDSAGFAINDAGEVTGFAETAAAIQHAYLWQAGAMTDLMSASPGTNGAGWAINAVTQIAGHLGSTAFFWDDGLTTLGSLCGSPVRAYGLDDAGQAAGESGLCAFVWNIDGNPTTNDLWPLGFLPGGLGPAVAHDLNGAGQIVGKANSGSPVMDYHAVLWHDLSWDGQANYAGLITDLGLLPGGQRSDAQAINNAGVVVGSAMTAGAGVPHAFVWDPIGGMRDLNDLIPAGSGWTLSVAMDINAPGQITGHGVHNGAPRGFLLTPNLWIDLGNGLAGTHGTPSFVGDGALQGGDPVSLTLSGALENAAAYLVLGVARLDAPFKGGILVPDPGPPGSVLALATAATGGLSLAGTWPLGLPSGLSLYFQYWIADPAGPVGFAASNAISGTTP